MDAKTPVMPFHGRLSFNPRARDGREDTTKVAITTAKVSIHAPVMDANDLGDNDTASNEVSIHAPVMDAKTYKPL